MFHKTVRKVWNLFKLSEQSLENSIEKSYFTIFDQSKVTFDRSIGRTGIEQRLRHLETPGFFFTISIDWAKVSNDRKCYSSNFHLENSSTWIFTLWNHILQTQPSLLQPILVYTYVHNIEKGKKKKI